MGVDLTPVVVPLRSKRRQRAQLMQKVQHLLPAALLLISAAAAFGEGARGVPLAIAVGEVVISVLFIASVVRALVAARAKTPGHAPHVHAIDWADVFVAGVFFAEGLERWFVRGHHKIVQPAFVAGTAILAIGLLHGRIFGAAERRRSLRIDSAGISMGTRPFGRFAVAWNALKAIEIDARYARIVKRDGGQRRIDLNDVENPAPVRRALEDARRRITEA